MIVGDLVKRLIEAGADPATAAEVISDAFARGVSTGIPPEKVETALDKRRAWDRERKRKSTGIPVETGGIPETAYISKDSKKVSNRRGSRIPVEWLPSSDGHNFALHEGFSVSEIDREVQKFRDYWTAKAGAGGTKLDWDATWRQWVRNSADRSGKTPAPTLPLNGVAAEPAVDWDRTASLYAKTGHWSRWAGPAPDHTGCQCPREVLQKHGIEVNHG
jgi:hypothetical protein